MKKMILGLAAAALLPMTAQANELIVGVKGGLYHIQPASESGFDPKLPAVMVSGQVTYEFLDLLAADIAFELEAAKSITDVELEGPAGVPDSEVDILSGGAYFSARSAGPIYAIGRIGYARTELENDTIESDEDGVAVSVGVGFSTGLRGEVELTRYELEDDDEAYYLSLGFHF